MLLGSSSVSSNTASSLTRLVLANSNCRAALLPVEMLDGTIEEWDTSRFLQIGQVGQQIVHHCVEAMGIPGLGGNRGIEAAGRFIDLTFMAYSETLPRRQQQAALHSIRTELGIREECHGEVQERQAHHHMRGRRWINLAIHRTRGRRE